MCVCLSGCKILWDCWTDTSYLGKICPLTSESASVFRDLELKVKVMVKVKQANLVTAGVIWVIFGKLVPFEIRQHMAYFCWPWSQVQGHSRGQNCSLSSRCGDLAHIWKTGAFLRQLTPGFFWGPWGQSQGHSKGKTFKLRDSWGGLPHSLGNGAPWRQITLCIFLWPWGQDHTGHSKDQTSWLTPIVGIYSSRAITDRRQSSDLPSLSY